MMSTQTVDPRMIELLRCPVTKAPLVHKRELNELWCRASRLAYPIRDGFPVMLAAEARDLTEEEFASLR